MHLFKDKETEIRYEISYTMDESLSDKFEKFAVEHVERFMKFGKFKEKSGNIGFLRDMEDKPGKVCYTIELFTDSMETLKSYQTNDSESGEQKRIFEKLFENDPKIDISKSVVEYAIAA